MIVDRGDAQHGALLGAEQLPRHDIRVVLEMRDHDLVAGTDIRLPQALRDQIDALGRAADENDILDRWRVDEAAHLFAACSNASVERAASVCAARCTFEFSCA